MEWLEKLVSLGNEAGGLQPGEGEGAAVEVG